MNEENFESAENDRMGNRIARADFSVWRSQAQHLEQHKVELRG